MNDWTKKTFFTAEGSREVLIIGGTGTLGKAILDKIYDSPAKITILSREELKQKKLRALYPRCKYVLGDVRDVESLSPHFYGKDTVFHFAAMKHVELAEENPRECVKINYEGSVNVADLCVATGVPYCVFSSTDKAVLPINVYGKSKALAEQYFLHQNAQQNITQFSVFRWGNVIGSRGSVVHSFMKSLQEKKEVNITDSRMTRFWIDIRDAAGFVLDNYESAPKDRALIPPMKASRVDKVAELCARYIGLKNYKINYTGIRAGEKLHEVVHSSHESCVRSDTVSQYTEEELLMLIGRAADL